MHFHHYYCTSLHSFWGKGGGEFLRELEIMLPMYSVCHIRRLKGVVGVRLATLPPETLLATNRQRKRGRGPGALGAQPASEASLILTSSFV